MTHSCTSMWASAVYSFTATDEIQTLPDVSALRAALRPSLPVDWELCRGEEPSLVRALLGRAVRRAALGATHGLVSEWVSACIIAYTAYSALRKRNKTWWRMPLRENDQQSTWWDVVIISLEHFILIHTTAAFQRFHFYIYLSATFCLLIKFNLSQRFYLTRLKLIWQKKKAQRETGKPYVPKSQTALL